MIEYYINQRIMISGNVQNYANRHLQYDVKNKLIRILSIFEEYLFIELEKDIFGYIDKNKLEVIAINCTNDNTNYSDNIDKQNKLIKEKFIEGDKITVKGIISVMSYKYNRVYGRYEEYKIDMKLLKPLDCKVVSIYNGEIKNYETIMVQDSIDNKCNSICLTPESVVTYKSKVLRPESNAYTENQTKILLQSLLDIQDKGAILTEEEIKSLNEIYSRIK